MKGIRIISEDEFKHDAARVFRDSDRGIQTAIVVDGQWRTIFGMGERVLPELEPFDLQEYDEGLMGAMSDWLE